MNKKTILIVPALLCLYVSVAGQKKDIKSFFIGDRVPDLPLTHIINYKESVTKFSSFGHKLIILDFWGIHCGSCIRMFPLEDSLQKVFNSEVQIILVTSDSLQKTVAFIQRWKQNRHAEFSLPIVTEDHLLRKLFRHYFVPHYIWLAPDGSLLAQTLDNFMNEAAIRTTLLSIQKNERQLKEEHASPGAFTFQPPTARQIDFYGIFQNKK